MTCKFIWYGNNLHYNIHGYSNEQLTNYISCCLYMQFPNCPRSLPLSEHFTGLRNFCRVTTLRIFSWITHIPPTFIISPSKLSCDFYSEGVGLDTSQAPVTPVGGLKGPLQSLQTDVEVMSQMETRILLFVIHFPWCRLKLFLYSPRY